ncbi:MAG: hypothetical protein NTW29_18610 [Bacteroidetes bacterium]|nr:hypothetical protein [Bacteroidota bacterium]
MKITFALVWLTACLQLYAQKKDTLPPPKPAAATPVKPEILTSGFIDVVNNGQVNASARFIRLQLGEPGKFSIPLSLYSGVSNNNFQSQTTSSGSRTNEHLVNQYINPLSGLVNISVEDVLFFKRNKECITRLGMLYHTGLRVLTGYAPGAAGGLSIRPLNFLNSFGSAGLYFQTGAWERSNSKNIGVCWIAARYIVTKTAATQLRQILPGLSSNGLYHGWSAAWGVEINNLVNIKVIYYKYVKKPEIEYSLPIYQFSFQYSLR